MSGSSISEPTKEGYDLCKSYIELCRTTGPDVVWDPKYTEYDAAVSSGVHDDLPFIFTEKEVPNWPKLILCGRYVQAYETKLRLERQQQDMWDQAIKAHKNKRRREKQQKEAGGEEAAKKRNSEQSSGGHPGFKKRSTTRRRRRRSSNARKARKSRTTRRK